MFFLAEKFLAPIFFLASEGLANFSWEKKNTTVFFFFTKSGKKKYKILENRVSEWHANFSGEKNTIPLLCLIEWLQDEKYRNVKDPSEKEI